MSLFTDLLSYSMFFAPRGKERLMAIGNEIGARYLSSKDQIIALIGEAGAGKSKLIKGMFPSLDLTNDDEGIGIRPLPIVRDMERGHFGARTYHIDVSFEMAFTPLRTIADAILAALDAGRRVIVEHWELVYPMVGRNADLMVGIGEEIIVTRPNIFGPLPQDIANVVYKTVKIRRMAHTAEDVTEFLMNRHFGIPQEDCKHADVKHGFVLEFSYKPDVDLKRLQEIVKEFMAQGVSVSYEDEYHIRIGEEKIYCTGPRIHVGNTKDIVNFRLIPEFLFNPAKKVYELVGLVGGDSTQSVTDDLNKIVL